MHNNSALLDKLVRLGRVLKQYSSISLFNALIKQQIKLRMIITTKIHHAGGNAMLSNWKITSRLKLLMGALLGLALLIGGMGWIHSMVTDHALKSLYDDRLVALAQLSEVKERTLHNRMAVTISTISPEKHEKYRKEITDNAAEITRNLDAYMTTHKDAHEKELAGKLMEVRKRYLEEALKPAMEYMAAGETSKVNAILDSKVRGIYYELKSVVDELIQIQLNKAQKINKDTEAFTSKMTIAFMIVILGGGATAIWFGMSIIGGINRSLTELSGVMVRMATNHDLTVRSKVFGKGEIGQSAMAFNSLIDELAKILKQVNTSAKSVAGTAAQLSTSSSQIERGSREQSEAAAATAAAVEEMTVSIKSVSDNTDDVKKLSAQSLHQTKLGNESVTSMIAEIQRVQDAVNLIADSVQEFVSSAQSISTMTQQVKDIADQTNLLALNAAIEAARAGEQGRGFAVVADEVRKLAEKSAQSARQIDEVTVSLSQKSSRVDEVVQNGLRSLNATQEQVARVSKVLKEAGESVIKSTDGVNDIASSVSEQTVVSSEIARNIERIAQMSEESHAAVQSNAQDAIHLNNLSEELRSAVSSFKV
jgi:methyl-accepting chemotaxis protein